MKTNSVLTEKIRLPGRAQTVSLEQLAELARRVDYDATRLAGELRLERRTLTRRFRVELNCSPGEWLGRQQMNDAVQLLGRGLTVKEVAVELGYQQSPQFCREFRRCFGCTPSQYTAQRCPPSKLLLQISVSAPMSQTANLLSQTANAPGLPCAQAA